MVRSSGKPYQSFERSETGVIRKSWKGRIKVALVYPNTYRAGMSNLGFQTIYDLLNQMDGVVCERAFLPERKDLEHERILTIESNRSLSDFDIIAFSISFESDYLNLVRILEKSGIPLQSADRAPPLPLVIAGGVACFLNPEPIAPFIDCFFIGEAERMLLRFIEIFETRTDKTQCLLTLATTLSGFYVPRFYDVGYNADGTVNYFKPLLEVPNKIRRVILKQVENTPTCSSIITSETTFDRTFLVEVSRGCPHGCRFCSAGYIYRPPRFRSLSVLKKCLEKGASLTNKIGLAGAAISDFPDIKALCETAGEKEIQLSFSSLRADALTLDLIHSLKKSNVKTATIAPDAGSERMRTVINKHISEDEILHAANILVSNGIPNLKLYFMVGLPEESMDDVHEIVTLCKKIKSVFLEASRAQKRIGEITVGINPFVPKPFTPFQWVGMNDIKLIKKKVKTVKEGLRKIANIRVHSDSARQAFIQAVLSRGDRRVSDLLILCSRNSGNWSKTLKESSINTEFYALRERDIKEVLPWDFIDHGIDKSFLAKEYQRAIKVKASPPCPMKTCKTCGVCKNDDFNVYDT